MRGSGWIWFGCMYGYVCADVLYACICKVNVSTKNLVVDGLRLGLTVARTT